MTLQVDILLANPLRLATLADEGKIDLAHVRTKMGCLPLKRKQQIRAYSILTCS